MTPGKAALLAPTEALRRILAEISPGPVEELPLGAALGRALASDVSSPDDLPRFDQSAMDGYGFASRDVLAATVNAPVRLKVVGESRAGLGLGRALAGGESCRIFTGGPIPAGADAVLEQEKGLREGELVVIPEAVPPGRHVRHRGEELARGGVALTRGAVVAPAAVGLLSSLGVRTVTVHGIPRVVILTTGDELVADTVAPGPYEIRDSNGPALQAALAQLGIPAVRERTAADDRKALESVLEALMDRADILLVTGGVSVGDHDHVKEALEARGVKRLLWGVNQKPGKPLYAGVLAPRVRSGAATRLVFGLPGNPASVLFCFTEYVAPACRAWMGYARPRPPSVRGRLAEPLKGDRRWSFVRVALENDAGGNLLLRSAGGQGSHMLQSFAKAGGLAVLPPRDGDYKPGDEVEVHLL